MGCDIHTYVEHSLWTDKDGNPYWGNFTSNGGSRNYVMFGVLAGVRVPSAQLFEPKGMPEGPLGWRTSDGYWLHVAPDDKPTWANAEGWASRENAERWVADGSSVGEYRDDGATLSRVSNPGWHSHSWLTLAELKQAALHYEKVVSKHWPTDNPDLPPEWKATIAAMQAFEDAGSQTRLVFWFDS